MPKVLEKPPVTKTIDFTPEKIQPIGHKTVKPFTEAQLAALYSNPELNAVEAFVNEFVEFQLRSHAVRQQHKLHELLMNYLRVRNHLIVNSSELDSLKNACKETQKQLWGLDKASITESGKFLLQLLLYFKIFNISQDYVENIFLETREI